MHGRDRSKDAQRDAGPAGASGSDDWTRYGASRGEAADPVTRDAMGQPLTPVDRHSHVPDDLFLEYRYENGAAASKPARAARSRRFGANVATASIVGALGAFVVVVGLVASALMPPPPPTPSRAAPGPSGSSASAGAKAPPTTLNAHVGVMINLPMAISIPARDQTPDDGTSMFLTGPGGGFTMDPGTGTVQTVYSGTAFAKDMRRAVILNGLWVSSWPASATTCGPTCWPAAATYRIDPATGGVTKSLPATYLLGAASDGIWVAADGQIERLDASTGEVLSTTPWRGSGEPRIGCGLLWAFTPGDKGSALTELDPESGNAIGQSSLGPGVAYGPAFVEGQCWMMSGSEGASGGSTTLVWLKPNGTTVSQFDYPGKSVVTLDGEFWLYSTTRVLQRFEATSGVVYGVPYVLPVRPPGDDPKWLFSASRTVWMIDGTKLSGFDVPTGTSRVNG